MTENKRYKVKGSDDFFQHIEDTTFTEDKHEGAIYNIYQVVRRLNEQDEQIQELEEENEGIQNKVWGLIDYLELKHGIDKKEIKEYWNNGCDVE